MTYNFIQSFYSVRLIIIITLSILGHVHAQYLSLRKMKRKVSKLLIFCFHLFIFWVIQDASLIDLAIAGKCAPELGLILQAFRAEDANKE